MTTVKGILKLFVAALLAVPIAGFATSRDLEAASVTVYKQVFPDKVIYTYTVTNKGDSPIVNLTVGYDYYHGTPELPLELPTAITGPAGWSGGVITTEESATFQVSWETRASNALLPGQTTTGFRITVQQDKQPYTTGHWMVILNGPPTTASERLELVATPPLDTIPPRITLSMTPNVIWPPNNKMVKITANLTAVDDQDPNPVVKLDSISCNECSDSSRDIVGAQIGVDDREFELRASRLGQRKDGRVYTITYSATDASGNRATAQATVVVPHDQRKPQ
jgi:hypothetical protein